jgi:hypothetical protein
MMFQPATKIFLRTSERHAATWIADTIGDVEIERLRESQSSGRGSPHSYGLERQVEPFVMPSEISGLAALRGFMKVGNLVVRMAFPSSIFRRKRRGWLNRLHLHGHGRRPPNPHRGARRCRRRREDDRVTHRP